MRLRKGQSLCQTCKYKGTCEAKNDTEEAKVIMCLDWEKEDGNKSAKNRSLRTGKRI